MTKTDVETANAALASALDDQDVEAMRRALASGADPRGSWDDVQFLVTAVETGDFSVVKVLLDAGADVNASARFQSPALVPAIFKQDVPMMKKLVASGADVHHFLDPGSQDGHTLLTLALDPEALRAPSKAVVEFLLEAGVDPNRANGRHWTPLMLASVTGDLELVRALLAKGADPRVDPGHGIFAIDIAEHHGHPKVVELLQKSGSPEVAERATARMKYLWSTIGQWFWKNAQACYQALTNAQSATPAQLTELERAIGAPLPPDFRAYLELYGKPTGQPALMFFEYSALGAEKILERWQGLERTLRKEDSPFWSAEPHELERDNGRVQWVWWHPGWIPFAQDGGGNLYCVDLAPGPEGHRGQVIKWEMHGGPIGPKAQSFKEFIASYANALEQGDYRYTDGIITE